MIPYSFAVTPLSAARSVMTDIAFLTPDTLY